MAVLSVYFDFLVEFSMLLWKELGHMRTFSGKIETKLGMHLVLVVHAFMACSNSQPTSVVNTYVRVVIGHHAHELYSLVTVVMPTKATSG